LCYNLGVRDKGVLSVMRIIDGRLIFLGTVA
jgi:hypothetical protein